MKLIIWSLCGLFAAVWSVLALVTARITEWMAGNIVVGQAVDSTNWAMPPWASAWVDPAWVPYMQAAATSLVGLFSDASPYMASAVSWLVPMIWVVWGFGMGMLLLMTGCAHWLINLYQRRSLTPAVPGAWSASGHSSNSSNRSERTSA